ncbi:MAG: hypothetical protein ACFFDT_40650 [Candidatus Hodarchaeota archaeon]
MSKERKNVDHLISRIDELLIVLKQVIEDLKHVSTSLKSITSSMEPSTIKAPREQQEIIDDVKMMFPEELKKLLSFEEGEDYIIIRPRQFLGSENFASIASTVRDMGGDYISAGKESHFRVPRKKVT